jgi:hypothetical protein
MLASAARGCQPSAHRWREPVRPPTGPRGQTQRADYRRGGRLPVLPRASTGAVYSVELLLELLLLGCVRPFTLLLVLLLLLFVVFDVVVLG